MSRIAISPFYSNGLDSFLTRHRIGFWRTAAAAVLLLLIIGETRWSSSWIAGAMVAAGVAAISLATVGRLWCALYISGRKSLALVDQGPYSVCRHPLYVCNFLGLVGLGLLTESLCVAAALAFLFALLYPAVIRTEDRHLSDRFPAHSGYLRHTPAFWPRYGLYKTDGTWTVHVPAYLRNVADSVWFLLGGVVIETIDRLHELHWLPAGIRLL